MSDLMKKMFETYLGTSRRKAVYHDGKKVQVVLLLLLAVSLIVFMDLTHNYFNATFLELHDGIEIKGFFSRMLYGDDRWSLIKFYNGFILSLRIVILLGVTNIIFACMTVWKKN